MVGTRSRKRPRKPPPDPKAMVLGRMVQCGSLDRDSGIYYDQLSLIEEGLAEQAARRGTEIVGWSGIAQRYGEGDSGWARAAADGWRFVAEVVATAAGRAYLASQTEAGKE